MFMSVSIYWCRNAELEMYVGTCVYVRTCVHARIHVFPGCVH